MKFLCLIFSGLVTLASADPTAHEYAHRESGALKLDLHLPAAKPDALAPVILWMHRGGWQNGSRANMKLVEWLKNEGYAIVSIDYRLTDVAPFPAQLDDCIAGLQWIRDHGADHGLDPDCIVVSGLSAGAHLASLLGFSQDNKVIGVLHFYGPSDLVQMSRYAKEADAPLNQPDSNVYRLLDGPLREKLALAKEASPVTHLDPNDPPCLIIVGDEDSLMTQRQCQRLHEAATASGINSQLHAIPGAGHGGPQFSDETRRTLILKFLRPISS